MLGHEQCIAQVLPFVAETWRRRQVAFVFSVIRRRLRKSHTTDRPLVTNLVTYSGAPVPKACVQPTLSLGASAAVGHGIRQIAKLLAHNDPSPADAGGEQNQSHNNPC